MRTSLPQTLATQPGLVNPHTQDQESDVLTIDCVHFGHETASDVHGVSMSHQRMFLADSLA